MAKGNMDHIGVGLVCALLLLIQYGNGDNLSITSPNLSPTILIGDPINLTISYSSTPNLIIWNINGSVVALWMNGRPSFSTGYKDRVTLQEKYLTISRSTTGDSGEYSVQVTDANGDSGTLLFNVVVRERNQEIQSNDTGIYKTGENISLTVWYEGTPSAIFWYYNGNPLAIKIEALHFNYISERFLGRTIFEEDGSLRIYNTTKDDAGNYTINVITSVVPGSRSFLVKFYDAVEDVIITQSPLTVSEMTDLVNLSCIATSDNIKSVTWMKDGQLISNDNSYKLLDGNKILQIIQPNRMFSGEYSCNISNVGFWRLGFYQLHVYDPVENVRVTQSPQIVSENSSNVFLNCSASSGYIEAATWTRNGQSITTDLNYNVLDGIWALQIFQPDRTFSGEYSCNMSNAVYWSSSSLQLLVYDPVESVTVTQSPQTVNELTSLVNLSCSASSGHIESVTWMKNGKSIINNDNYNLLDDNKTLQIIQLNRTSSGEYSCKISNAAYWASRSLQLIVYDPVEGVTVTQSPQTVSEMTKLVNLSCGASSGYIESVTWMKDGESIINNDNYNLLDDNKTLQIIQPNRTFTGVYSCKISNAVYGASRSLQLIVYDHQASCPDYNVLDGMWALQIFQPNRTFNGEYSCNMSNAVYWSSRSLQLCDHDPVEGITVIQSPQTVSEMTSLVNLSCSASSGHIESVTWMKEGESIINNDKYNLLDDNKTLQIIQPNRTFSGTYSCKISNAVYGASRSLQLIVYDPVEGVTVTQSPQTVSEMTSLVTLSCVASSGHIESVTWMKNGESIINNDKYNLLDDNKTLQIIQPNRTFTGEYNCKISNAVYGASRSLQLIVYDPVGGVQVTQSPPIVDEDSPNVTLSCNASSGYIESVMWMKDGESVMDNGNYTLLDGNRTLQINALNWTFSGKYSCKVTNMVYWDSNSLQLRVYDQVKNVTVTQTTPIVSENSSQVNLSCSASSRYIESVSWMKDGESISGNQNYSLLDGNRILQINEPNRTFSGNYSCNVSNAAHWDFSSLRLIVYDPVVNVKVTQSPEKVNKTTSLVKLICNSSSGYVEEVKWTKNGEPVNIKDSYGSLDGNRVLQITKPNKTFSGIYTCNMSNAAYWSSGFVNLTVSYAPLGATSTFSMIITSLLGGILLAH